MSATKVTGDVIATGAITAALLATGAVSSAKIASNAITAGLVADDAVTARTLADSALAAGFSLINGYLDWSVATSILTVAVKTLAGTDPSTTDPVRIVFRSSTAATGSPVVRELTAATSIAINDTALLGTSNSTAFRLWCVAFDDAGTVRLALINCLSGTSIYPLAGWGIASATLEDGASDSAHVFYSDGAAVASKAYATLGYATWESGLATAGTWSAAPTRAQLFGTGIALPGHVVQVQRTQSGAVATGTTVLPRDDTIPQSGDGVEFMTQAITPTSAASILRARHLGNYASSGTNSSAGVALFQDATAEALAAAWGAKDGSADGETQIAVEHHVLSGTTSATTFKIRAGTTGAGTTTFNGVAAGRIFGGVMVSYLEVQEIMA